MRRLQQPLQLLQLLLLPLLLSLHLGCVWVVRCVYSVDLEGVSLASLASLLLVAAGSEGLTTVGLSRLLGLDIKRSGKALAVRLGGHRGPWGPPGAPLCPSVSCCTCMRWLNVGIVCIFVLLRFVASTAMFACLRVCWVVRKRGGGVVVMLRCFVLGVFKTEFGVTSSREKRQMLPLPVYQQRASSPAGVACRGTNRRSSTE